MKLHTVTTHSQLPSVHKDRRVLEAKAETFGIEVPDRAAVRSNPAVSVLFDVTVPGSTARVKVFVHREVAGMTARDYGAEIARELPEFFPGLSDISGGYGSLAGRDSPVVRGQVGRQSLVARCACPGGNRILAVATFRTGDEDAEGVATQMLDSIAYVES